MAAVAKWLDESGVGSGSAPTLASPDFVRSPLRERERDVVRAIADALLAGDAGADRLGAIAREVDLYVGSASTFARLGLRSLLFVLRLAPLLLLVAPRSLDRLELDARIALLARLERMRFAPLSLAFIAWRTIILLVAYDDAEELVRIGYLNKRTRHKRMLGLLDSGPRVVAPAESGVRLTHDDRASVASLPSSRSGAA